MKNLALIVLSILCLILSYIIFDMSTRIKKELKEAEYALQVLDSSAEKYLNEYMLSEKNCMAQTDSLMLIIKKLR